MTALQLGLHTIPHKWPFQNVLCLVMLFLLKNSLLTFHHQKRTSKFYIVSWGAPAIWLLRLISICSPKSSEVLLTLKLGHFLKHAFSSLWPLSKSVFTLWDVLPFRVYIWLSSVSWRIISFEKSIQHPSSLGRQPWHRSPWHHLI